MKSAQELQRLALLRTALPELWTMGGGTCLYIGASMSRFECVDQLNDLGFELTLVEPFAANADFWRGSEQFKVVFRDTIQKAMPYLPMFDVVFWWHGPEHVTREEFNTLIRLLPGKAKRLIVLASPWGVCPQSEVYGNTYEIHMISLYEDDYTGYQTATIGQVDIPGSHLMAWKRI